MRGAIAKQWGSYHATVMPAAAPAVQVEECRRAFYAGNAAMRAEIINATECADVAAALDALEAELNAFVRDLMALPDPGQASDSLNSIAVRELVGICQWIDKTFDMGADRSQVADPTIIARREIYAGVLARIAELKEGA